MTIKLTMYCFLVPHQKRVSDLIVGCFITIKTLLLGLQATHEEQFELI